MSKSTAYLLAILILVFALVGIFAYWQVTNEPLETLPTNNHTDDQSLVKNYLQTNISQLTPEPAVLGGTFYVTEIKCENPGECLVEYEDGHIALVGLAKYQINNGQVEVKEFQIVGTDENTVEKTGYLTDSNGVWVLVYEEPGKPALTLDLVFDQQSNCLINEEPKVCVPEDLIVGSRVTIQGLTIENQLMVRNLVVVELTEAPEVEMCIDQCGDGVCNEIVCLGTNCPCAETLTSCPIDCQ